MVSPKSYRHVVSYLERNGYRHDRTNSKGAAVFVMDGREDVGVGRSINDNAAKLLVRNIERVHGAGSDRGQSKRKPDQIKERRAADRANAAAEVERRLASVADLLAARDERKGRAGFTGTDAGFKELIARIEQEEKDLRYWQGLMTEVPRSSNKVRHRS